MRIGLILALLAYLEYQKWIKVDWTVVQTQASIFMQISSQKLTEIVDDTAHEINQHNINHVDMALLCGVETGESSLTNINSVKSFLSTR